MMLARLTTRGSTSFIASVVHAACHAWSRVSRWRFGSKTRFTVDTADLHRFAAEASPPLAPPPAPPPAELAPLPLRSSAFAAWAVASPSAWLSACCLAASASSLAFDSACSLRDGGLGLGGGGGGGTGNRYERTHEAGCQMVVLMKSCPLSTKNLTINKELSTYKTPRIFQPGAVSRSLSTPKATSSIPIESPMKSLISNWGRCSPPGTVRLKNSARRTPPQ
mmetsp:Transcript_40490/g.90920  ORF Transcript_40490/g.90920 Transcript_40490/m.90920 type:complete len:222 (-) Transcript_40490:338-1003(-)